MTSKERAKIYRKAAELIITHESFACHAICHAQQDGNGRILYWSINGEHFPEFFLFKPDTSLSVWWHESTMNQQRYDTETARIIALLLSAEMALNP